MQLYGDPPKQYSGTSIKRTPLGNSLLAIIYREVVFLAWEVSIASYVCSMSNFLLQMNLLTASLAHTSFEKAICRDKLQLGFHDCAK